MKKMMNWRMACIVFFSSLSLSISTTKLNSQSIFAGVFGTFAINIYNLKAVYTDHSIKLNWELLLTGNEAVYEVERSLDGVGYNSVINGMITPGNTTIFITDWDHNLPTGTPYLYYRLKITGKNGQVKRSMAVRVSTSNADNEQVTVFPNPAKNKTSILLPESLTNTLITIVLTNSSGQTFREFVIPNAREKEVMDISGIPPGTYYWRMSTDKKQTVYNGKLEIQ